MLSLVRRKKIQNNHDNGQLQKDLDKKLVYSLSKSRIPNLRQFKYLGKYLKARELWLLRISILVIIISLFIISARFYIAHLETVPVAGGTYVEGLIGAPKYINPLYASVSDVDNDISRLIYSSLFKRERNGELMNDLVLDFEVSDDNKVYTFKIRQDVLWHDGTSLTVDDIIFTFNAIKDNQYKSPLKPGFVGVSIERVDNERISFALSDPYAAFLELLTFGILPADLWSLIQPESASLAELNLKPVGSGLYKFDSLAKDKQGNVKEYKIAVNENYYGQKPFIELAFRFFPSFEEAIEALNNNTVDGLSYLPQDFKENVITPKTLNFHKLYLPQLTVLFFNSKENPALGDKAVRQALAHAIDRNQIINEVLDGGACIVDGPILPNSFVYNNEIKKYDYNILKAKELLDNTDWREVIITEEDIAKAEEDLNSEDEAIKTNAEIKIRLGIGSWRKKDDVYLTVRLTTVERNENNDIIEAIKIFWEAIGVKTEIEIMPPSRIQAEVLKPRFYEVLFYGQVVGADPDPYAFWHSSQANEDGFNIANYNNKEVDKLLEDARLTSDRGERQKMYRQFQEILTEELPAFYVYSPVYTYIQSKSIKGFEVNNIFLPSDRFTNIADWYMETGKKLIW
ncbi:peptide ABC transporter substrate-binding protein [bacterium]|nr:peptide ABC transporter substrate-binding protein [bacterium]